MAEDILNELFLSLPLARLGAMSLECKFAISATGEAGHLIHI